MQFDIIFNKSVVLVRGFKAIYSVILILGPLSL